MPINANAVGETGDPVKRSWTSKDGLLYAVGVGAGTDELAFTTENTKDTPQQMLPTFAVIIGGGGAPFNKIGSFNPAMLVHGEQGIELFGRDSARGRDREHRPSLGDLGQGQGCRRRDWSPTSVNVATGKPLLKTFMSALHSRRGRLRRRARPLGRPVRGCRPQARPRGHLHHARGPGSAPTACRATATRCTRIRRSPSWGLRYAPSCTACAPTASAGGHCCTRCAAATRRASRRWMRASRSPCSPETR